MTVLSLALLVALDGSFSHCNAIQFRRNKAFRLYISLSSKEIMYRTDRAVLRAAVQLVLQLGKITGFVDGRTITLVLRNPTPEFNLEASFSTHRCKPGSPCCA